MSHNRGVRRRIVILGSTGSIGEQAVGLLEGSEEFDVVGLSAGSDGDGVAEQADRLGAGLIAIADAEEGARVSGSVRSEVLSGAEASVELIERAEPDVVLNAIVGAAGLRPSIAALAMGLPLALANKESLVIAGDLLVPLAEGTGGQIIPVDSEHSAIEQLLRGEPAGTVERVVLTASGGPFLDREDLSDVAPEEALEHPTWNMGGRITVDSATLMNKGFEMIEAHHLFGLSYESIDVLIHPQSLVHALIEFSDGAQLAHLGMPDMRVPIGYALSGPDRWELPVERLDLASVGSLEFREVDDVRFPALGIARRAGEQGGASPCVLNAADEVAVEAFLAGGLPFKRIPHVVESVLGRLEGADAFDFDQLFEADLEARALAGEFVGDGVTR
jgi:1-deoxy-D-xylulose-5-phosphate reductoisomerase